MTAPYRQNDGRISVLLRRFFYSTAGLSCLGITLLTSSVLLVEYHLANFIIQYMPLLHLQIALKYLLELMALPFVKTLILNTPLPLAIALPIIFAFISCGFLKLALHRHLGKHVDGIAVNDPIQDFFVTFKHLIMRAIAQIARKNDYNKDQREINKRSWSEIMLEVRDRTAPDASNPYHANLRIILSPIRWLRAGVILLELSLYRIVDMLSSPECENYSSHWVLNLVKRTIAIAITPFNITLYLLTPLTDIMYEIINLVTQPIRILVRFAFRLTIFRTDWRPIQKHHQIKSDLNINRSETSAQSSLLSDISTNSSRGSTPLVKTIEIGTNERLVSLVQSHLYSSITDTAISLPDDRVLLDDRNETTVQKLPPVHLIYIDDRFSHIYEAMTKYNSFEKHVARSLNSDFYFHAINPKGVGQSTGHTHEIEDLIDDYFNYVLFLLHDSGENPLLTESSQIVLYGEGRGGLVATAVAKRLLDYKEKKKEELNQLAAQQKKQSTQEIQTKIKLTMNLIKHHFTVICDRVPYSTVSRVGAMYPFLTWLTEGMAYLTGWGYDIRNAYRQIPIENKLQYVFKPNKESDIRDSLFQAVKETIKKEKQEIKNALTSLSVIKENPDAKPTATIDSSLDQINYTDTGAKMSKDFIVDHSSTLTTVLALDASANIKESINTMDTIHPTRKLSETINNYQGQDVTELEATEIMLKSSYESRFYRTRLTDNSNLGTNVPADFFSLSCRNKSFTMSKSKSPISESSPKTIQENTSATAHLVLQLKNRTAFIKQ